MCVKQRTRMERLTGSQVIRLAAPSSLQDGEWESADVTIRRGSARRIAEEVPEGAVSLILTTPPPVEGGEFLPLSFLWSGWLLGREAARLYSPSYLLHPKRADDWAWFYQSMLASLRGLGHTLAQG